mmetsp:Transcript_25087/g.60837  ORF Transcript_25087/g.60837 Transcript_25087/m.60837 type:complete len:464 (+) Transcript_25087:86-1477(+)
MACTEPTARQVSQAARLVESMNEDLLCQLREIQGQCEEEESASETLTQRSGALDEEYRSLLMATPSSPAMGDKVSSLTNEALRRQLEETKQAWEVASIDAERATELCSCLRTEILDARASGRRPGRLVSRIQEEAAAARAGFVEEEECQSLLKSELQSARASMGRAQEMQAMSIKQGRALDGALEVQRRSRAATYTRHDVFARADPHASELQSIEFACRFKLAALQEVITSDRAARSELEATVSEHRSANHALQAQLEFAEQERESLSLRCGAITRELKEAESEAQCECPTDVDPTPPAAVDVQPLLSAVVQEEVLRQEVQHLRSQLPAKHARPPAWAVDDWRVRYCAAMQARDSVARWCSTGEQEIVRLKAAVKQAASHQHALEKELEELRESAQRLRQSIRMQVCRQQESATRLEILEQEAMAAERQGADSQQVAGARRGSAVEALSRAVERVERSALSSQ